MGGGVDLENLPGFIHMRFVALIIILKASPGSPAPATSITRGFR